jgi:hypothetical protein
MASYSEKLQNPLWQRKRLDVFNRDKFKCRSCNDEKTELNVHHLKYTGAPWQAPLEDLITLCRHCHSAIETVKADYALVGQSFKVVRSNIVFLAIPEDDIVHLFKIQFGMTSYLFSLAGNVLKDFVHHIINWWLEGEKEENLNLYIQSNTYGKATI